MKRIFIFLLLLAAIPIISLAAFDRDLSLGSRGDGVKALQEFLARDNAIYPEGLVTGFFGSLTKAAVIRFQEREGIAPAVGYVGPKTRGRLNALFGLTTANQNAGDLPALLKQLEALQKLLAELQSKATTTPPVSPALDTTPPAFIQGPDVTLGVFDTNSPFGADAPVRITVDWKTDEPTAPSTLTCTPELAISGLSLQATYWARESGAHSCALAVQDPSGNKTASQFSFNVPFWVALSGSSTAAFAENAKLGDISVRNASSSSLLLFKIVIDVEDALDAPNSRGNNYKLLLRNGTSNADALLSSQEIFLHSQNPSSGNFHKNQIMLYAGVQAEARETKTFSLWIESLEGPFYGGFLRFRISSVETIPGVPIVGEALVSLSQ